MESTLKKLAKYDISQDRYMQQKETLFSLGFDDEQAHRIIIKKCSNKTVETLINQFENVKDIYSYDDLTRICSKDGGGKTLIKIIVSRSRLTNIGVTDSDIVNIASNGGGYKTLQAVSELQPQLIKIGFNVSDIVNIASNIGGSKTIQAVIDLQPKLTDMGFKDSDIVNIDSNIGGSKTLEYIVENKDKLKNKDLEYIKNTM